MYFSFFGLFMLLVTLGVLAYFAIVVLWAIFS